MKKPIKEPPFTMVNGKKRYSFRCEVVSEFRPPVPATQTPPVKPDAKNAQQGAQTGTDGGSVTASETSDDVIRTHTRLLSAIYTWSGTWFGPQLVDNGANDAFALRKVAGAVNNRTGNRAVPVVWDHSLDAEKICGRLVNGAWEDSSDIPPGSNAYMEIPPDLDPRAYGLAKAGMIPATSIWWSPSMEQSHPDMDFNEFVDRQGEIVDGKPVCWIPVDLTDDQVIHHAIVWAGADPHSGPREGQGMQNAAPAASDTRPEGGRGMEEQLRKMVETVANAFGVDVKLGPGSAIPDTLEKQILDGVTVLCNTQTQYNDLASKLQTIGTSLLREGETTLSAADVLNRLPERIELAKHGEAFLKYQQQTALGWFDKAKVDPQNKDSLSDVDKRRRERIANSMDLQFLADEIDTYQAEAKSRFGPAVNLRVTEGQELSTGAADDLPKPLEQAHMTAMVNKIFRRGDKK